MLGEPLPVEFANTVFVANGELADGLTRPAHLAAWLHDCDRFATPLPDTALSGLGPAQLARARALRDAVRSLLTATVAGTAPGPEAVETVNRTCRRAPIWRELAWDDNDPRAMPHTAADPVTAALAELAQQTVDLLSGPRRHELRACGAPRCVLLFVRDHPRREWCSPSCGNRARVARHYQRHRTPRPTR